MIWSMKTAQAEHSTEFGLFEQNLTGLVKSGKCTLVKHEMFTDKRNKTGGELYVVKRLAGHFPDYLDRPTPVPENSRPLLHSPVQAFPRKCTRTFSVTCLPCAADRLSRCRDLEINFNLDRRGDRDLISDR